MLTPQDIELLESVESGDLERVRLALDEGADVTARKRVTLICDISKGHKAVSKVVTKRNLFRKDVVEERVEEQFDHLMDVGQGESALALAIINGDPEIVRALLDAKADPNTPIEWQVADAPEPPAVWTSERWNTTRWARTYRVESALLLAVGRGAIVTDSDGSNAGQQDSERGILRVNQSGGMVALRNPVEPDHSYIEMELQPRPDIIPLLVEYGARVTSDVFRVAKLLQNGAAIESAPVKPPILQQPTPAPSRNSTIIESVSRSNSLTPSVSEPHPVPKPALFPRSTIPLHLQEQQSLWRRSASPSDASREQVSMIRQPHSLPLHQNRPLTVSESGDPGLSRLLMGQIQANDELRKDNRNLRGLAEELARRLRGFEQRVAELQSRNAELTQHNMSLQTEVLALRQKQHVGSLVSGTPVGSGTSVKQLFYVVGEFRPREPDEVALDFGQEVFCSTLHEDGWGAVSFQLSETYEIGTPIHVMLVLIRLSSHPVVDYRNGKGLNLETNIFGYFPMSCLSPIPAPGPSSVFFNRRTESLPAIAGSSTVEEHAEDPFDTRIARRTFSEVSSEATVFSNITAGRDSSHIMAMAADLSNGIAAAEPSIGPVLGLDRKRAPKQMKRTESTVALGREEEEEDGIRGDHELAFAEPTSALET
ncbi:hypothetical protein HDU93_005404 [Gonapodya sp. JEL0774]|nr:hypothetical protein HDU93_005404 [Gonapodya sp. JEL0774]